MEPYHHKVQYYETDKMGVTHHANYIHWMEEARIDLLDQLGFPFHRLEAMGVGSPVMSVECRYKAPTTFADDVTVQVWVAQFRNVRIWFSYEMKKADGTLVCQARSEHCFVSPEGNLLRLNKRCPELAEKLAGLVRA